MGDQEYGLRQVQLYVSNIKIMYRRVYSSIFKRIHQELGEI